MTHRSNITVRPLTGKPTNKLRNEYHRVYNSSVKKFDFTAFLSALVDHFSDSLQEFVFHSLLWQ